MRPPSSAAAWVSLLLLPKVLAHPGLDDVLLALNKLDTAAAAGCWESTELIGDLQWLNEYDLYPTARLIRDVLRGEASGQSDEYNYHVPPLHSPACAYDTCCVWQYIADDMERAFRERNGECNNAARGAVRLGFHDAAGWSKYTGQYGGADGSIVLAPEETERQVNAGLREIIDQYKFWFERWRHHGVSMADLIQMGANVATVVCPLGPRVLSFVGRYDNWNPAPDGLLPSPFDTADNLIEIFRAKTIQPKGLVSLLGAHSTSRQRLVDPSRFGAPQDSTPGVWDTLFYKQILGPSPASVFNFQSDLVLSRDPRMFPTWKAFAGPNGQQFWDEGYAREYVRLSLLGVYNINNLTDCTRVLPPAKRSWGPEGW
ncbi:heme peroxidase [Podospora didyma]|uniref:Peroxidase n=1 Tax=Podospora didyma TaxID=330526 RepID=A0AAE0P504_9PEZI|nr:heme peroxidase [Podospora didyma]